MDKAIKMSIRTLVEFLMRRGSIDNRHGESVSSTEGIKAHQHIQKSYGEQDKAEVPLKYEFTIESTTIKIDGRADGILIEDDNYIIDEIKTIVKDVSLLEEDHNELHWAQGKCYAYIYALENKLEHMTVQLTYCNYEEMSVRRFRKEFTFAQLEAFFLGLIEEYKQWLVFKFEWDKERNKSIEKLSFPFEQFRPGQRELAARVYKSIVDGNNTFAQAPTGIGKTMSTVFPSLKAMGQGATSKIFYLTAKTITREVAENSLALLRKQDLKLKSVTLTAKEKICKMDEVNCNPDYCPYANGHFDRVNDAVKDMLRCAESYDRNNIEATSEKYKVCPFELALDLTTWSDMIICDYNYAFDPRVYLKRFFDTKKTDYTFLIDEAHNLVDRARSMYSASLLKTKILDTKKKIDRSEKKLHDSLNKLNTYFLEKRKKLDTEKYMVQQEAPTDLLALLEVFLERGGEYLEREQDSDASFLEFYFDVYRFIALSAYYDEHYVTLIEKYSDEVIIKLYCVDPSKVIQDVMKKSQASIVFSATLMPMDYFTNLFGATDEDYIIGLRSPFSTDNRLLMVGDRIATTYTKREQTAKELAHYIAQCVQGKKGNYMVFFPSYSYMELVYYELKELYPDMNAMLQERKMSEEEKEAFLQAFHDETNEATVGFCVLGGHFSEGIDLVNDKLIGVIIVGVGMPQIGVDRDIIKNYFDEKDGNGFENAYVYPGMIKVLQAVGRCIRTEQDKGVILLLDYRYGKQQYKQLFPPEWYPNVTVRDVSQVKRLCQTFWEK
ncbi:MAG: ATP-dependent DNA helicase [Bacillaceae bacterium]